MFTPNFRHARYCKSFHLKDLKVFRFSQKNLFFLFSSSWHKDIVTGTLKILSGIDLKHAQKVTKICLIICQIFKELTWSIMGGEGGGVGQDGNGSHFQCFCSPFASE